MIRAIRTLFARGRLRLAEIDLQWSRLDGSSSLIARKQAAYDRELSNLLRLECEA